MGDHVSFARREFVRFLAASPYLPAMGGIGAFLHLPEASGQSGGDLAKVITDPKDALNVLDFEEPARRRTHPGHWACTASGVDDDARRRSRRRDPSGRTEARDGQLRHPHGR